MVNKKLDQQDIDFIIKKASEGNSLSQIQGLLKDERDIEIKSRTTIANVIKKAPKDDKPKMDIMNRTKKKDEIKPQAQKKPISEELKPKDDKSSLELPKKPRNESLTETNRNIPNFEKVNSMCVSSIFPKFYAYLKENADKNPICKTLLKYADNKWRRIIMDTIDILIAMRVIR